MSHEEVACFYGTGSWAIDDLIRLLERIADEAGAEENGANPEPHSVTIDGVSLVGTESVRSVSLKHSDEIESVASPHSPVSRGNEELSVEVEATSFEQEFASCANDDAMQTEFESLRQVLVTHAAHPLLDEELREFLEPEDTDIPTEFLGNSVREVLETPFVRVPRRWVVRGHVRCLLNLLGRAVASIRSLTGCSDENATVADDSLRPRRDTAPRELPVDGKSWRAWCDVIHIAGWQRLKLGLVAECLNDLPTSLWDQPLANFTTSALAQLAGVPGLGPTRFEVVVAAVRGLAVELMDLRSGTSVRLKFIPGPLRAAQDWIERTLEARVVPDLDELTIRLLRPLARQLQHDLAEREAQIAVHRLRLNESSAKTTLEELAAVHGVTRERIRQLEQWGPRVLQVRFSQGRYLLEALHGQLTAVPGAHQQASFVRRIATKAKGSALIGQIDLPFCFPFLLPPRPFESRSCSSGDEMAYRCR